MAGVRFAGEFQTSTGTFYKISIYDSEFSGSATTIKLGAEGFNVNWRGENNQMYAPVLGSECEFEMIIEDSKPDTEQFITDIATSKEARFFVGIFRGPGGQNLWWSGIVVPDIAVIEDESKPYAFTVKAVDGLGLLRSIDYRDADFTPYSEKKRLIEIIEKCLNKLPHVSYYWEQSDFFIISSVNWYEQNHSVSSAYDPLYYTWANESATWSYQDESTWGNELYEYKSCYDVLSSILTLFGARIYLASGVYHIEQIESRRNASFFSRRYTYPVGAPIYETGYLDQSTISPSQTARRKLEGGRFSWYPALQRAELKYSTLNRRNYWPPKQWFRQFRLSPPINTPAPSIQPVIGDIKATFPMRLSGKLRFIINDDEYDTDIISNSSYALVLAFYIKLSSGSTYWLKREANKNGYSISYPAAVWSETQTQQQYEVVSSFFTMPFSLGANNSPFIVEVPFDVILPPVPADGTFEIGFDVPSLWGPDDGFPQPAFFNVIPITVLYDFEWSLQSVYLEFLSGSSSVASGEVTYYAENPETGNSSVWKGHTIFADGDTALTLGRLQTESGGIYTDTANWGVNSASGTQNLQVLLVERLIKAQNKPTEKMYTTVYGDSDYHDLWRAIVYDNKRWIPVGCQYTANLDHWQGEWFASKINTIEDDIPQGQFEFSGGFGNAPILPEGFANPGAINSGNVYPATLNPLSSAEVNPGLSAGAITSITVDQTLAENAFVDGENIILVNPQSGESATLEVTANTVGGQSTIAVTGTLENNFPIGSYIIKSPKNDVVQGGVSAGVWTVSGDDIYRDSNVGIGTTTLNLAQLNVEGDGSAGVGLRVSPGLMSIGDKAIEVGGNATTDVFALYSNISVTGANTSMLLRNASTASNTGNGALLKIEVPRSDQGDPVIQLAIGNGDFWQIQVDNDDSDAFKITKNGAPSVNTPFEINTNGITVVRQIASPSATLTVTAGAGAGTGATVSSLGGESFFFILLTTGTGTVAGDLFTVTLPRSFPAATVPVFSAADADSANEISKFHWKSSTNNSFIIEARAALTASTSYSLAFFVGGY